METQKPVRLNALTGLRCFAAINIVLFHFSNPQSFGFLAPVVNAGYIALGLFFLLSGFVLAYNYSGAARAGTLDKVRFWKARFTRLYPVYLLSLLMSWRMVAAEYGAHAQPVYWKYTALTGQHGMFWVGMALTPLLLQGWVPTLATFLNTPAWAMPAEAFYVRSVSLAGQSQTACNGFAQSASAGRGMGRGHGSRRCCT